MPLTLPSYTDPAGNVYPASVWRIHELILQPGQKLARITFSAHKDAAALTAGKAAIGGATKQYILRGADFDKFRAAYTAKGANHIEALAETFALAKQDIHDPAHPGQLVSFFAGAVQS